MRRKAQLLIGIVLALAAFGGVLVVSNAGGTTTYPVVVVYSDVPAFTPLEIGMVMVDDQAVSAAVAQRYVLADQLDALLSEGAVVVENLHTGQPLMREQVASGTAAAGLSRLSVALRDPDRVIISVPVDAEEVPSLAPGDVVALFFAAGQIQAQNLVTDVVTAPEVDLTEAVTDTIPVVDAFRPDQEGPVTDTVQLVMPVAKWLGNGVVYRLNYARRENPNYGAPGMETEPRYVTGEVKSLDVVVHREDAEWFAFALAHGQVQVSVLPAVTRADVEAGTFPTSVGVTWTDFERRFFDDRLDVPEPVIVTTESAAPREGGR